MARDEIAAGIARSEFDPFLQPKIDVASGSLAGVEILMRWRHPERGIIAPAAFIPVMESHGLISDAMFAVFEKAVKFISRCRRLGLKVSVAVNVSPQSLCDMTLPGRLEAITSACGLSPAWVTIEITETVPMTDLGHALETLSRCRMKGFELSIDDYGTGHSSLQQLIQLPLNELKIARAFVTGASQNPVLEALIQASVTMARRLNLRTVAEGVETAEDWDMVAHHGCDVAQGYFIARPMTPEQLIEWYAPWLRTRGAA
jgi:EAL domain-containing protein (putative c-di-GMP-specific phosphodiesterase class I)